MLMNWNGYGLHHPEYEFDELRRVTKITLAAPGIPKEKVAVEVRHDRLYLKITDRTEDRSREFSWALPVDTVVESVECTVLDGVITIRLPQKAIETRKIPVKSA